jgi:2-amino-4-hydroxy-6-hydroxymethyldihydropteridine diphosphokinase
MSLIIATGSNIGDKIKNLQLAKSEISKHFDLIAESGIFESSAVDYTDQPDFYNQVLEFKIPSLKAPAVLDTLLSIEKLLGRSRDVSKGPRTVDIDIIFWSFESFNEPGLKIPHPSWDKRSFVVRPLQQLPFFQSVKKCFNIPTEFNIEAKPI